jgi:cytochrome c oxidase subunit I+III
MLFILGFFFVFTVGGLTGVMLAVLPFDWQAHDTHFVVAHLHYVLIGGMLFPLLAGFYYWAPVVGGRPLSERLGRWVCGLLFAGVNVTFLPMHLTGLLGMPRRVYTYPPGLGWDWLNLISSLGALLLAAAVVLLLLDVARHLRPRDVVDADPWRAGTLEWLPHARYGTRSIPRVESRYPLWDRPELHEEVTRGEHYLPGTVTGRRETLVTSPRSARPQYVALLPGPGWPPLLAAVGTAAFFLLLTVKLTALAAVGGVFAFVMLLLWAWGTDRAPCGPVEVADGVRLPVYVAGPMTHSWWAMIVIIVVLGATFASLAFAYLYLAMGARGDWPPAGVTLPWTGWGALAGVSWLASSGLVVAAGRALRAGAMVWFHVLVGGGVALLLGSLALEGLGQLRAGLAPARHAYDATVATVLAVQAVTAAAALVLAVYSLARAWRGLLDGTRRVTFDNAAVLWHYTVAQGLAGLALVHLGPRWLG